MSKPKTERPAGKNTSPLAILGKARKPHKKKKNPYIYKKEPPEELIKIKPLPKTQQDSHNFDHIDKILSENDPSDRQAEPHPSDSDPGSFAATATHSLGQGHHKTPQTSLQAPPHASPAMSSLPEDIVSGRLTTAKNKSTQEKYQGRTFPVPRSKKTLKARIATKMPLIPKLLAGEEELSIYYTLAYYQRKSSPNAVMSSKERWDLPWPKFIAGFYGLKRQQFISTLIQTEHGPLLSKSKNTTIRYWSPDMFATYVLANEIVLRLVMEDLALSKSQAERLLQETVDYGCHIADELELEDDLDFGELQLLS